MIQAFHPSIKSRYDFDALSKKNPILKSKLIKNQRDEWSIDFSDNEAVIALNQSILQLYFGIKYWEIPAENLCPPIPSRAHYIYHLAELLNNNDAKVLDIGCGANLIYPLLGTAIFNWQFIATDIEESSLTNALELIEKNQLQDRISLRMQSNPQSIFLEIIQKDDFFDAIMCNPPFYSSTKMAEASNARKNRNIHGEQKSRNFGGKEHEIVYPGGEFQFINNMIYESKRYKTQVNWFTCLVSKSETLKNIKRILDKSEVKEYRVIEMAQGQKTSRILAWTY